MIITFNLPGYPSSHNNLGLQKKQSVGEEKTQGQTWTWVFVLKSCAFFATSHMVIWTYKTQQLHMVF